VELAGKCSLFGNPLQRLPQRPFPMHVVGLAQAALPAGVKGTGAIRGLLKVS
jgi:hypothetical protein